MGSPTAPMSQARVAPGPEEPTMPETTDRSSAVMVTVPEFDVLVLALDKEDPRMIESMVLLLLAVRKRIGEGVALFPPRSIKIIIEEMMQKKKRKNKNI
jgi:hypothetical protein